MLFTRFRYPKWMPQVGLIWSITTTMTMMINCCSTFRALLSIYLIFAFFTLIVYSHTIIIFYIVKMNKNLFVFSPSLSFFLFFVFNFDDKHLNMVPLFKRQYWFTERVMKKQYIIIEEKNNYQLAICQTVFSL